MAGYWRRFAEGVAFLRGEPILLTLALMVAVTNLLDAAFAQVLVPVWARESGHGPAVIGAAVAAAGLSPVLVACGATYFLTVGLTGLRREWREMDQSCHAGPPAKTVALGRSGGAAGGQHGGDLVGQGRVGEH